MHYKEKKNVCHNSQMYNKNQGALGGEMKRQNRSTFISSWKWYIHKSQYLFFPVLFYSSYNFSIDKDLPLLTQLSPCFVNLLPLNIGLDGSVILTVTQHSFFKTYIKKNHIIPQLWPHLPITSFRSCKSSNLIHASCHR